MSPRRLDPASIESKLELMVPLIDYLTTLSVTEDQLSRDIQLRLSVERVLQLLVDIAAAINTHAVGAMGHQMPNDYQSSFDAAAKGGMLTLELAKKIAPSAGMRNVLTHRYAEIELAKVAAAVPLARAHYSEYVGQVSRWLLTQQDAQ